MKTNTTHRRGFTLVELLVVIVIIASLAGLTAPMVIRQRKKADATEATSNARQIGLALFEFETEHGSYPQNSTGTKETLGEIPFEPSATITNSEDAFRQLFVAGITQSEDMFYAKIKGAKKPDGAFSTATSCLENGENGFAYVMADASDALSTGGNPSRALVVTPMVSATNFDPDPFDGKAIYLKIDNSVSQTRIRENASGEGTTTLFDTGTDSVWGSDAPTVKIQENNGSGSTP